MSPCSSVMTHEMKKESKQETKKKEKKKKKGRSPFVYCQFLHIPFLSFFLIHSFPLVLLPSFFTGTSNLPPTPLPGWRNPRVASWWRQTRCVYVEGMKMPAPELRRWCNSCEMQAPTPPSSHRYPHPHQVRARSVSMTHAILKARVRVLSPSDTPSRLYHACAVVSMCT